ncbi:MULTISPECIES: TldD/PmbA family protein [Pseudomonas]|jgi:predicted Zn-dependent protease|uniref:TldD/PmbA family protein n=1 Tax=Pseudomonas qingdaonensis TaxID=2056231 RepID=A0ABX8DSY1_9PSED|nr:MULTISPECIES: TldD/PmbA family protein [Pseudomonas]MBG8561932.1 TldD/PmbA family protein [Pseudomonas qingdaonensis]MCO7503650.1 TldD/PmbA family protein [Pseudomonas sp. VE 267-6A]MCO7531403.1 TldD/PmbA family protein [Pseudomonas sp. 2]MDD1955034.1 TldD/PmbA family protein [Pseudomonas sp. 8209]MEC6744369.1 TldD/PmbA family protein [Pseudomonas qingdaonensis]
MFDFTAPLRQRFAGLNSGAEFFSLRYVQEAHQHLSVRKNIAEPPSLTRDQGAMLTVRVNGVEAYAATADLSQAGLQRALDQAEALARQIARHALLDLREQPVSSARADYCSPNLNSTFPALADCYELLARESASVPGDSRLVNWQASLGLSTVEQIYLNSAGAELRQAQRFVFPGMSVTAFDGSDSQSRSLGRENFGQQGGVDVIERCGLLGAGAQVADQALQLLLAPNTPSGVRDLLLMPDQMMLQIHESIGHPLEMDRILGDERNYAGTSFIKAQDFGHLQYGSALLNVTFDPAIPEELASYAHDDDGTPAHKQFLIREGVLVRPLGGALSQFRSGLDGVANSRACGWNRAPIDRMANLNIEPGDKSLAQLIGGIEHGILMRTNRSWSIDDARNKFQFGCEWGQLIEHGELKGVVKNPNYRGISAGFWRNLSAVGDASTFQVLGTPNCGKGEPNQVVRVGHASPACVFSQIDVFGGDA